MKQQLFAYVWLRIWGTILTLLCVGAVFILAEPQRLSELSLLLFQHQESIKNIAIMGIFLGVYFIFYSSGKTHKNYLRLKLFKGSMKMHPDLIKQTLEKWLNDQNLKDVKLMQVKIIDESKIGLELKTSNLHKALYSLEDMEFKLKEFMQSTLGIDSTLDVQLFEI